MGLGGGGRWGRRGGGGEQQRTDLSNFMKPRAQPHRSEGPEHLEGPQGGVGGCEGGPQNGDQRCIEEIDGGQEEALDVVDLREESNAELHREDEGEHLRHSGVSCASTNGPQEKIAATCCGVFRRWGVPKFSRS